MTQRDPLETRRQKGSACSAVVRSLSVLRARHYSARARFGSRTLELAPLFVVAGSLEPLRKRVVDGAPRRLRSGGAGAQPPNPSKTSMMTDASGRWRRGWDSNPRTTCAVAGFQDRCDEPLCHPSAPCKCSNVTSRAGSPGERHLAYCSAMTALFIACADGRVAPALAALQEKEGGEGGRNAAVGAGDEEGGHGGAVCQMALAGTTRPTRDVATLARRGGVAERFIAPVLKTGNGASRSWVRIPPPPPFCRGFA